MKWSRLWVVSFASLLVVMVSGCTGGTSSNADQTPGQGGVTSKPFQVTKEPLELTVYYPFSDGSPESFMENQGKLIQEKYPNFSFKWINTKELSVANMIGTGNPIDIISSNANNAVTFDEAGYLMDMTELAKKHQFDLNRVEPVGMDMVKNVSGGKLSALPIYINTHIMFYNKDIFDRFGVQYPKDKMTWDDTYELAKKLTRLDGGVQYVGFSHQFLNGTFKLLNSYGQEMLDPKTKEVTMSGGKWPDIMRNFQRFFQIPGNEYLIGDPSLNAFAKDQRLAMQITLSNRIGGNPLQVPPNWDIVSHPTFADLPGVGAGIEPYYFYLSATSKHKDEAFLAISALLSDEAQIKIVRQGKLPSAKMANLGQVLEREITTLKGRNANALVTNKYPVPISLSAEALAAQGGLSTAFSDVMSGKKDINTALRDATELANNALKTLKETKEAAAKPK